MATPNERPLVAIFADRGKAEAAVDELWHAAFDKDSIGLAARGEPLHRASTAGEPTEEAAAEGAVVGAASGTILGAAAGVAAVATLPGLGPILAGGALMGVVVGAAAGAAIGSFAGPFIAMGLSQRAVAHYENQFHAGRCILVVKVGDRLADALVIVKKHGPLELWLPDETREILVPQ
jgi:hypothetical protein